jgi:phage pi2 protein 07
MNKCHIITAEMAEKAYGDIVERIIDVLDDKILSTYLQNKANYLDTRTKKEQWKIDVFRDLARVNTNRVNADYIESHYDNQDNQVWTFSTNEMREFVEKYGIDCQVSDEESDDSEDSEETDDLMCKFDILKSEVIMSEKQWKILRKRALK